MMKNGCCSTAEQGQLLFLARRFWENRNVGLEKNLADLNAIALYNRPSGTKSL